jgi:hypothetical protein
LYADDPEFVSTWATYCVQHRVELRNPAGFLRNALKGESYPPEAVTLSMPEPALSAITPPPDPAQALWQQALAELELQLVRSVFDTWLRPTRSLGYDIDGQTLLIQAASMTAVPLLSEHLASVIQRSLRELTGEAVPVRIVPPTSTAPQ